MLVMGQSMTASGWSLSVSGDVAVIGAQFDGDDGTDFGSAYVFRFDGNQWIEETKLLASDGQARDRFGWSVSIDGNTAVIGRFGGPQVYVFRFDGNQWFEEAILLADDGQSGDMFGWSVSIDGETAVIGAYEDDDNGSAYVFHLSGDQWTLVTKLLASDGVGNVGYSVSISGNTAVIGASGCAYIFDLDIDGDGVPDDVDNCYLYNPDQADCNDNGIGDVCDIADQTSYDCDQNGEPDECQPDCDGDGWIDPCDTEGDCDDDGIPDNCELDCNENSIPDDCDIIFGISEDCNENGVPDECDIAGGSEEDCNENGVPDSCDLADDPSLDCDGDGIYDSCRHQRRTSGRLQWQQHSRFV